MENVTLLKQIGLFSALSGMEIIKIAKLVRSAKYAAGEQVIREGDAPDAMYIIKSGSVRVYSESNPSVTLRILGVGEHFGEIALIDKGPRSASVTTDSESELLLLDGEAFREVLDTNVQIKLKVQDTFLTTLCDRLRETNISYTMSPQKD